MNKGSSKDSGTLFSVPLRTLHVAFAVMTGGSFISCILISLLFDFESATATHCQVRNYLPSISAAIGFAPQRYIWRISIALIAASHYLHIVLTYKYFSKSFNVYQQSLYQAVVKFSTLIACMEINGLVGLTYVSSTDNYSLHEKCFIVFISCAITYMFMYLVVIRWAHEWQPLRGKILKAYIHKRNTFLFNAGIFALAVYFFIRHNTYCEPGVYSLFALCEYLVVLSNIYSHLIESLFIFDDREYSIRYPDSHDNHSS
ncbi:post-GPI attachment to proteins factor 2-like [Lineus longissimus]|uniref:post-GPI attachment to proteins factor 2-like n=1 Tax=Lineus longissimus TaxID=88925 RepID=UPI002B4DE7F1